MTPVYQTIFNAGTDKTQTPGNCLQAAVASLLDLQLEEVPHFLCYEDWFVRMKQFLSDEGYAYNRSMHNPRDAGYDGCHKTWWKTIKHLKGVNGFFLAEVHSPKFFTAEAVCAFKGMPTHAVIIDRDFNIVHDPNPNYADTKEYPMSRILWPNGVLSYEVIYKL